MAKRETALELDNILKFVSGHSAGISAEVIGAAFPDLTSRTIQRRLTTLVESEKLVREGKARSTRYRAPLAPILPTEPATEGLTLSPNAENLRRQVRAPRHHRTPVGYNRSFLDEYKPNPNLLSVGDSTPKTGTVGPNTAGRPTGGNLRAPNSGSFVDRFVVELQLTRRQHLLSPRNAAVTGARRRSAGQRCDRSADDPEP